MVLKRIAALALALALAQAGAPVRAEEEAALPEAPGAEEVIVELEADALELPVDGAEALWLDPEAGLDPAGLELDGLDGDLDLEAELASGEADGAGQPASNAPAIPVDRANFPDSRFRSCVSAGVDLNGDGRLSADEVAAATALDVSGRGIRSLEGVGRLSALQRLACRGNSLSALDLSGCVALEYLDCSDNELARLDVSGCPSLVEMVCANNRLASLDTRRNGSLARLDCRGNRLKAVDFRKNSALSALYCQGNDIAAVNLSRLSPPLRRLVADDPKGKWNDGALFWFRSRDNCLYLPGLATVKNGKRTIYTKRNIINALYIDPDRDHYGHLSDREFANFRNVATTGMGRRALYRSSSPLDTAKNRNEEAMAAMAAAKVRTVINMNTGLAAAKRKSTYSGSYYASTNLWARQMGNNMRSAAFRNDVADLCRFMIRNEGPYLVHCHIGRDRTGLLCALLECLMGASMKEVTRDYMKSYENYFNIMPGSWEYDFILNSWVSKLKGALGSRFGSAVGVGSGLAGSVEKYLRGCGLKQTEITALKKRLSADY